MKITFLVIGRTTDKHIEALTDEYRQRLSHYVKFEMTVIPELKNTKNLRQDQQKTEEGLLLLRAVPQTAELILLDERGKELRSIELADMLQKKMSGGRDVVFAIGGPYGFSGAVYQRADGMLSLSKLTFSHQMIRPFFVEQLYRAMTIQKGEPYHHE